MPNYKVQIFTNLGLSDISCFVLYNCIITIIVPRHYYYIWHWCTDIASEIYNVNCATRFDNATQIRISDAQQCQTISAIVAIIVLIIAFTITPISTMVTPSNRHRYIVTVSQYSDATTSILFSDLMTLSTITVEMNNAWKRGETITKRKREPAKRRYFMQKKRYRRSVDSI